MIHCVATSIFITVSQYYYEGKKEEVEHREEKKYGDHNCLDTKGQKLT